jgi:hypothetical protein
MQHWTTLDLLLVGRPDEIMPGPDREKVIAEAKRWYSRLSLTVEERQRIHTVWIDGGKAPAYQATRQRWADLRKIAGDR